MSEKYDSRIHRAIFRFYEELNDFLPRSRQKKGFEITFSGNRAIKDTIESLGVPHTEVDLILANSNSVGFEYQLKDNDRISVYPVFESLDIGGANRLCPAPLRNPCFICDVHLGKLARYLRLLGFNTLYRNNFDDMEIVVKSRAEKRTILTRDIGLLKISAVIHGYWVRSTLPFEQIREVVGRFNLASSIHPFRLCMECNGEIGRVDKQSIIGRIPTLTALYFHEFYECTVCLKIYWKGSHYSRLTQLVDELTDVPAGRLTAG